MLRLGAGDRTRFAFSPWEKIKEAFPSSRECATPHRGVAFDGFSSVSPIPSKKHPGLGCLFDGAGDRTRTCTLSQRNLNPPSLPIPPRPHDALFYHGDGALSMRRIWWFGINISKSVVNFVQFFLTIPRSLSKIDSVWCTLTRVSSPGSTRFMITGVLPGFAFCASWRFVYDCLCSGCHCEPVRRLVWQSASFCDATHRAALMEPQENGFPRRPTRGLLGMTSEQAVLILNFTWGSLRPPLRR